VPVLSRRVFLILLAPSAALLAQNYDGPRPPKKDIPYIRQASNLIQTEVVQAKPEGKKDDATYVIDGASSSAATPLAEPIFIMQADKIAASDLELYKLESKNGHRELQLGGRGKAHSIQLEVSRLTADGLWKLEVDETLDPGEYSLSPRGSNQAFCFEER